MVSVKENCRQSEDLVYAELLNRIRIGNHSSDDLEVEVLSKRVCGTGDPFDQECAITENATVLCMNIRMSIIVYLAVRGNRVPCFR